ncbi:MAG: PhzF family phenazine biosynthesis protein [Capsulimonadaceae bacterium]|nr:PhzF family phenazine biosynthesis protein [Capsulimonadaceae bacterium]
MQFIYVIDAFADAPYRGNPAAVCLLPSPRTDAWMQTVAREMNLSETAFLLPIENGYSLRWFTPALEIALCGHATLASAHALWSLGQLDAQAEACFSTLSGPLTCRQSGEWIEMDFPGIAFASALPPKALVEGIPAEIAACGTAGDFNWLIELPDAAAVRSLHPDFGRLSTLDRGVIVTAASDDRRYDFVSRYFVPFAGVNEDPVTGSAHCALGPYWSHKLGRTALTGYQTSARGGVVKTALNGDRVLLQGQAHIVSIAGLVASPDGV